MQKPEARHGIIPNLYAQTSSEKYNFQKKKKNPIYNSQGNISQGETTYLTTTGPENLSHHSVNIRERPEN